MDKKTIRTGLRSSIAGRWMFNTLSVVGILLVIANVCIYYFTRQYYYGSAENYVVSEANATATVLSRLYEDMAVNYSSEVRELIEGFDKKEQMEMMSINKNGEVTLSSSGFSPDESYNMPDYEMAMKSEDGVGIFHGYENGENIIAVTVTIAQPSSSYNALRYVTSMKQIDSQLGTIMLAAVIISAAMILMVISSGMYFVKSICVPLMQISVTAKKLAKGDFSERIAIRNNDEIGELSRVFNDMADELENSEAIKNDFISSVSHELRTPLTAIKGWSETLQAGYDEDTYRKGMTVITHETGRLEGMVEELLDFSRIQNGRFSLQMANIDIIAELDDALLIYTDKARKENKTVHYTEPEFLCVVYGDKNRLRQVFINVIDNAIKYTDPGGSVDISVEKGADTLTITVADTGIGIAASDLPKVKAKFYKADNTRRGSGIGLAVADEIISMHGGSLDIDSVLGKGTTVTITLPLKQMNERSDPDGE
ncbi:MAG: HAMP domain-containing sensor histidine kinase [Oscillospiraceae bacterium]|nr:HAMP domain-containing sensor histidine kinase [Oscillospiraceae bacterium]